MLDALSYLRSARVIAIVGCSGRSVRTSHTIARYLSTNGFEIVPVNPNYDEVLGRVCYNRLADIPYDVHVDVVNIFRNGKYSADIVQQVVDFAEEREYKPLIWTQIGVSSARAEEIAQQSDIPYIRDRCIMVEHRLGIGHVTG
jgi:uncharacterized protein